VNEDESNSSSPTNPRRFVGRVSVAVSFPLSQTADILILPTAFDIGPEAEAEVVKKRVITKARNAKLILFRAEWNNIII
jgi:hypothetical protein